MLIYFPRRRVKGWGEKKGTEEKLFPRLTEKAGGNKAERLLFGMPGET